MILKIEIIVFIDSENYIIVTSNLVNSSIDENRGNLSNFLNNECVKYRCDVVPII